MKPTDITRKTIEDVVNHLYEATGASTFFEPPTVKIASADARWFTLRKESEGETERLILCSGDLRINAGLKKSDARFGHACYEILDTGGLAFDHAAMIADALNTLRGCAKDFKMIFDFLPPRL